MIRSILVFVFVLVLVTLGVTPAHADDASYAEIAAARLAQEPALTCVAFETGMPAALVAIAKIDFDQQFGFVHNLTTPEQWAATYGDRFQFFTDNLGVPNPTRDGAPLKWCARLIHAQQKILQAQPE